MPIIGWDFGGSDPELEFEVVETVDPNPLTFKQIAEEGNLDDTGEVAKLFTQYILGSPIENFSLMGSEDASWFVQNFFINKSFITGGPYNFKYESGIMLSSGGYPGKEDTKSDFTVIHDESGDPDLTATAQAAFPDAGATNDASVLEFDVNVTDPDVDTFRASLVFGSEEFPEFADSDYVDIAAVYVNDVNYAKFESTGKPLSVISDNLQSGVFVDNDDQVPAPYAIEWDGFSREVVVRAPVTQGLNTIKIGVADTGDASLDSGLFVSDLSLQGGGGSGGGLLKAVTPDETGSVTATIAAEEVTLNDQPNTVTGTAKDLNGDVITGFTPLDVLTVSGNFFDEDDVTFGNGSVITNIDTNQDGDTDTSITFAGLDNPGDFVFSQTSEGTSIELINATPPEPGPDDDSGSGGGSGGAGPLTSQGDDIVNGNDGPESIMALGGNDIVYGNVGDDTIGGSAGDDQVYGNRGVDEVYGNQGDDLVFGGQAGDLVFGGQNVDQVYGNLCDDQVYGNKGQDDIFGGQDNDDIFGGQDGDLIYGNRGDDRIYGNLGEDTLYGGEGVDEFAFMSGDGQDTAADFSDGDTIALQTNINGSGIQSFSDLEFTETEDGDTVIELGDGNSVTFQGVAPSELSDADFSFF